MATGTEAENNLVVCEQCHQSVDKGRIKRHQTDECEKQASVPTPKRIFQIENKPGNLHEEVALEQQEVTERRLQKQQQVAEQRLHEQQQVTEQLQEENRNLINELNGVKRNQHRDHSLVWIIVAALAILLALLVGLHLKQTGTQNVCQALNKSMAELAQSLEQYKKISQANKETLITAMLEEQEIAFNRSVHELEQEIMQLRKILCPGSHAYQPASSCQQILNCDSSSSSGYYWIASADGNATELYCSMNKVCAGVSGGWMRVVKLDMRNIINQCPSGLRERVHPGQRFCGKDNDEPYCSRVFFNVNSVKYDQVCGKIIAYQFGSPASFCINSSSSGSIDEIYLDGISLTYGKNPRKHIWSFAAALDEVGTLPSCNCPCTNIPSAAEATAPPHFVGNDYFCDTGSTKKYQLNHLYTDDPLWDGAGCGPDNTCCSLNNPPWFFKQLQSSTSEDIEMRVCCDQPHENEDIYIEQIELHVH